MVMQVNKLSSKQETPPRSARKSWVEVFVDFSDSEEGVAAMDETKSTRMKHNRITGENLVFITFP